MILGDLDFEYSNDILKNLCDTLVQYKKLYAFRYVPLKNLFQRDNIHRKIELHAALYLIKKIFVSPSDNSRMSHIFPLAPEKITLEKQSTKKRKMIVGGQVNYESSEDENIPEDEDIFGRNSRKTIQTSIAKKDTFMLRH